MVPKSASIDWLLIRICDEMYKLLLIEKGPLDWQIPNAYPLDLFGYPM